MTALSLLFGASACGLEDAVCSSLDEDAAELREASDACETDADCVLVDVGKKVPNSCLDAFQCFIAINKSTGEIDFLTKANVIDQKHKKLCTTECTKDKCSGDGVARCDPTAKRCVYASPKARVGR